MKPRHNLAVLRKILGLTQPEMAKLVRVSPATIASIEANSGRLKLSESLAERISDATGVSYAWLLENELTEEPRTKGGLEYTREEYERVQGQTEQGDLAFDAEMEAMAVKMRFWMTIQVLCQVLPEAHRQGRVDVFLYRLWQAVENASKDFVPDGFFSQGEHDRRDEDWRLGSFSKYRSNVMGMVECFDREFLAAHTKQRSGQQHSGAERQEPGTLRRASESGAEG
jgi:transcriptional regulator with XRE-family HTH domain